MSPPWTSRCPTESGGHLIGEELVDGPFRRGRPGKRRGVALVANLIAIDVAQVQAVRAGVDGQHDHGRHRRPPARPAVAACVDVVI